MRVFLFFCFFWLQNTSFWFVLRDYQWNTRCTQLEEFGATSSPLPIKRFRSHSLTLSHINNSEVGWAQRPKTRPSNECRWVQVSQMKQSRLELSKSTSPRIFSVRQVHSLRWSIYLSWIHRSSICTNVIRVLFFEIRTFFKFISTFLFRSPI